jgi:hypothetical protein
LKKNWFILLTFQKKKKKRTRKKYREIFVNFVNGIIKYAKPNENEYFYLYRGEVISFEFYRNLTPGFIWTPFKPTSYSCLLPCALTFSVYSGEQMQGLYVLRLKKGDKSMRIKEDYIFGDKSQFSIDEKEFVLPFHTSYRVYEVEKKIRYGFPILIIYCEIIKQKEKYLTSTTPTGLITFLRHSKLISKSPLKIPKDLAKIKKEIQKKITYHENIYEKSITSKAIPIVLTLYTLLKEVPEYFMLEEKQKIKKLNSINIYGTTNNKWMYSVLYDLEHQTPTVHNTSYYFFSGVTDKKTLNPKLVQFLWPSHIYQNDTPYKINGKDAIQTYKFKYNIKKAVILVNVSQSVFADSFLLLIPPYKMKMISKTKKETIIEIDA